MLYRVTKCTKWLTEIEGLELKGLEERNWPEDSRGLELFVGVVSQTFGVCWTRINRT